MGHSVVREPMDPSGHKKEFASRDVDRRENETATPNCPRSVRDDARADEPVLLALTTAEL